MPHRSAQPLFGACAVLLLAASAQAQMYRSVGPDGRVTYSDRPPATVPVRETVLEPGGGGAGGGSALPYALAQIAQRYPGTFYTGKDCAPCASGRNLLIGRGIPFSEKIVESNDDAAALQRLTGANSLPALSIGGQVLRGFSDLEWSQYLDAAGYPKTSQLPAQYQPPVATPLVAARPAPPPSGSATDSSAAPTAAAATPPAPSLAPRRTADNPTGIRF